MAYDGRNDDEFDLDDDGILRDSMSGADNLLMDDDGIMRGTDELDLYKHVTRGHWTDSGIGGDKQSVTSTLKNLQNSFEEDLAPIGDESINISEFEASKDELSEDDFGGKNNRSKVGASLDLTDTMGDTLETPRADTQGTVKRTSQSDFDKLASDFDNHQLFTPEYYNQLRELGVLVDGADLSRDSLNEFEELESRVASRAGEYDDKEDDNRDLIGEYLESEYIREQMEEEDERRAVVEKDEEEEREKKAIGSRGKMIQERVDSSFSRPSSGRTVSSRTFPDDEDYYDEEDEGDYRSRINDSQNLGSQGGSQPARMTGDEDDELFYINSRGRDGSKQHTQPKGGNIQGQQQLRRGSGTPTGDARSRTPVASGSRRSNQSPGLYDNNKRQRRYDDNNNKDSNHEDDDDAKSFYSESGPTRSRPSSAASHISTASENVSARQKRAEEVSLQRMSKAKSQESFFEDDHATPRSSRSADKHQQQQSSNQQHHHKRLLPTPNTSISNDPNQSFKLKSKSVTNIAAAGPVKPTHMSISEITRLTNLNTSADGEDDSTADLAEKSTGELTDRLTQESQKRKHATELVQQLQLDYDNLLTKYALAELTIDQMRLGAKINIHADSPTPGQALTGVMSPAVGQSPQVLQLRSSPANAVSMRSSPAHGVVGHVSPLVDSGNQTANIQAATIGSNSDIRSQGSRLSIGDSEDGLREDAMTETEKVKADLQTQASGLDEKLESFYGMLENQQLTLEQEAGAFEQIRSEHDALRRSYLTAKDDYNILKRSGAFSTDTQQQFDTNKELEGQLFRLGMRFDEVQERVEGNQAKMSPSRQPFQQDTNKSLDRDNKKEEVSRRGSGSHPSSPSVLHPNNHNQSMDSTDGGRITERRVGELREDYNASMDAYRKLKYADETPEGQREVDNVVRRLHGICTEMPEMFRLSPEIQARWDNLEKRDRINLADRKSSVWEKLNQREQTMKSQRQSPVPQSPKHRRGSDRASPVDGRPPSILRQTSDSSDMDSLRLRMDGSSRSSLGSILPDRMDRPPSRQDRPSSRSGLPTDRDRPSSRASSNGYGPDDLNRPGGSRDHNPNLPRPRRHDQRGVRDPKLAPMPNMGSMGSLPDSGISDQENGNRRRNSHDRAGRHSPAGARGGAAGGSTSDVLNSLPGSPYKKSGKMRGADDADSGFLGSMVGSGVGLPPGAQTQQQQQQQQQEQDQQRVLRLRRPAEESTSTDQSMDALDYQDRQRSTRSRNKRMQDAASSMTGQSYDGSEDTLEETQEGDTSIERHMGGAKGGAKGGTNAKTRRKSDSRDFSLDATLEEEYSEVSDVSTPRAVNQTPSKGKEKRSSDSKAPPSKEKATPRKSSRHQSSSKQQSTSEDEDLKKALELERARQSKSHRLQDSSMDESPRHKRLKSPPPALPRPKSRGSPTTDLYKTRERRNSDGSVRSRRSVREEVVREERKEPPQSRAELRLNQRGPELERPRSRQGRQTHNEKVDDLTKEGRNSEIADRVRDYESRSSIGSDVEVGSNLTRASSTNSNRLKLLQEEIEKLKEGVAKANEKASQPHPIHPHPTYPPQQPTAAQPLPDQQQPDQQRRDDPEFYDPFDDPYGFMRMPRRRANSFSGGREREWDEWYWTLPQNRQYDGADIPLGYAAADAYADVLPNTATGAERNSRENVRNRLRQRRMGRKSRDDVGAAAVDPQQVDSGAGSGGVVGPSTLQPQTQATAAARMNPGSAPRDDQAMYDYYVPSRYSTQGMRSQIASQGYFTTPSGAKIYSSNGGQQQVSATPNASSPWYQIRRAPRQAFGSPGQEGQGTRMGGRRTQSYDDVRTQAQPPVYAQQTPTVAPGTQVAYGPATYSQTCPMCGVAAEHTHANYTHHAAQQPYTYQAIPTYARETTPSRTGRRRSRSASRSRHYTPERTPRSRTRYHVREYDRALSDSFSDDDRRERGRRSRSLTRERSRSRPTSPTRHRRHRRKSFYSGSDSDSMEEGLDKSLSLSVDISRLTKRMMGSLKGELRRSKDKREFGSSYW